MSKKNYLWIEDKYGKAAYTFWKILMKNLYPNVIVESKKNCSELVKAVKTLKDEENNYIIALDNSFDNLQICKEQKILKKYADSKNNIKILRIICFEYILLEFNHLIEWIYAPNDEFLQKRATAISAREKLINILKSGNTNYKIFQEILEYDNNLKEHNIEQLSSKLLFTLTRNTGFEVTKGKLGDCWINSCCDWKERQNNDICGLDSNRLSVKNKMQSIYFGTSLNIELLSVGLEATV